MVCLLVRRLCANNFEYYNFCYWTISEIEGMMPATLLHGFIVMSIFLCCVNKSNTCLEVTRRRVVVTHSMNTIVNHLPTCCKLYCHGFEGNKPNRTIFAFKFVNCCYYKSLKCSISCWKIQQKVQLKRKQRLRITLTVENLRWMKTGMWQRVRRETRQQM